MTVSETGIVLKLEGFNHKLAVSVKYWLYLTPSPSVLQLLIVVTLLLSSAVVWHDHWSHGKFYCQYSDVWNGQGKIMSV